MASIAKYIYNATDKNTTDKPKLYYSEMPEDFAVPSVFFPAEDIEQRGDTFGAYAFEFVWPIKFFHSSTRLALENGKAALSAISANRNLIPIIEVTGERAGYELRLKKATIAPGDSGAAILTLSWASVRPFTKTTDAIYAQTFVAYLDDLTTQF